MSKLRAATGWLAAWILGSTSVRVVGAPSFYAVRQWGEAHGVNLAFVSAIAQTTDGYLWFGTPAGLFRCNGFDFRKFDPRGPGQEIAMDVTALLADTRGGLWIGTLAEGLHRFERGEFTAYGKDKGLTNDRIKCLFQDSSGVIWVGTDGGGTFRREGDRFAALKFEGNQEPSHPTAIAEDGRGRLWIGTHSSGILVLRGGRLEKTVAPLPTIKGLLKDRDGQMWLGTSGGLVRIVNDRLQAVPLLQTDGTTSPRVFVTSLTEDRWGALWVGTLTGLVRLAGNGQEFFGADDGLGNGLVTSTFADREGSVWAGTEVGDLHQLRRQKIKTVPPFANGLQGVNALSVGSKGRLWIGGTKGLVAWQGLHRVWSPPRGSLAEQEVSAMGEDQRGRLWFATRFSDWGILDQGTLSAVSTKGLSLAKRSVHFFLQTRQHGFLAGTSKGLLQIQGDTTIIDYPGAALSHPDVTCAVEQRDGILWVGTGHGLNRVGDGEVRHFIDLKPRPMEVVYGLVGDTNDVLWISTYRGLWRVRDGKFFAFGSEHGAPPAAGPLVDDGVGNLWIGLGEAIGRIAKSELNAVADGLSPRLQMRTWSRNEGLRSVVLANNQSGALTSDGFIHFATDKGVAVVNPVDPPANDVPPLAKIESIIVNGDARDWSTRRVGSGHDETVMLPPGYNRLEIYFTALSYSAPQLVSFGQRLRGLSEGWEDAKGQRVAFYRGLPAGAYEFQLTATNEDGIPSQTIASLRILALAPWWQTNGFKAAAAGLFATTVASVYSLRIRRLKQLNAARREYSQRLIDHQENERSRLAKELHDSFGQDLLIIKNQAAMLEMDLPKDRADLRLRVREIGETSQTAIDQARSIAYNLRPAELDRVGLTSSIEAMIDRASASSPITFAPSIQNIDGLLAKENEVLLYRVSQELINNVLKHSGACNTAVALHGAGNETIELTVTDDGRGFKPELESTASGPSRGLGLSSVRERVEMLNGTWHVESKLGEGTRIRVRVPIAAGHRSAGAPTNR